MPAQCFYNLNGQRMSTLTCVGIGGFAAFSGSGVDTNNPASIAIRNSGPLPLGLYYIVARPSGGRMGWLYDFVKDQASGVHHEDWFALYRDDGQIDDYTVINGVRRGNFRIHPNGRLGRSEGCITIAAQRDFARLRQWLLSQKTGVIPRTGISYYGTVIVR
ncbi:DUF2778 domain-containing protein [Paraburkholderia pallida]|uniref:DUF2778 domain-containing protein n=1 Tax=Paraburkholderia pallida TaxID=2547399 RepID=A0A4P7CZN4_9BURK|nr:DUF2778 domain-containing protein [Paraburkholderia pallida]QBR00317.1 DUF2778 domain-containing protein [Paraburkholderia pallida]